VRTINGASSEYTRLGASKSGSKTRKYTKFTK
jgi:hypothetical protein